MTPRLSDLATDVFATIFAFRAAGNDARPPFRVFRQELIDALSDFERRAKKDRLDPSGDALFALIALGDETVLASDWEDAEDWRSKTLAMELLQGETRAGEVFFDRLEKAIRGDDEEVLQVFFTALCAGFRGRYFDDPGALRAVQNRLYQRLVPADPRDEGKLTPDAYGRNLERPMMTRRFPIYWALPFVFGVVGLYAAYYVVLGQQAEEIAQESVAQFNWSRPAPAAGR